jgi:uncharacterized delta-60 repeat protein
MPRIRYLIALILGLSCPVVLHAAPGSLDTSFGSGVGWVSTGFQGNSSVIGQDILQQADGKLVVVGFSFNGTNDDFALARYNSDGSLDTTFSGDGKLTTAIGTGDDSAHSVIQQADGKLVVAGSNFNGTNDDFALVRYNSDGSLDTTFSSDGKLTTAIGAGDDSGHSVIQQTDGKLVVAGSSSNSSGTHSDFALVRYNSDGSLDTTFSGDGKLTTIFGAGSSYGYSVIQQADGQLVVAGSSSNGTDSDFALVRYNSDGSLDATFSDDGKLTTAIGTDDDSGYSVIQQADGQLVVVGDSRAVNNVDFALARYNSDGSLDTTFSDDGKITTSIGTGHEEGSSVIQQADGRLLVSGSSFNGTNENVALLRYNSDGSLDTTFSGDGKLTTAIGSGNDYGQSVIQQMDGKLVVAGSNHTSSGTDSNDNLGLVRYNSDGTLDTAFDADGKLTTAFSYSKDYGQSVIQQTDGKLVVAGYSYHGASDGNSDFALARYNSNGALDATFDADGILTTAISATGNDAVYSVIQQADGKLMVAGYCISFGNTRDFSLARYSSAGALDTSFSGDGKLSTFGDGSAYSMIRQADGKLVMTVGGNNSFSLMRYNSNGVPDTTFSGDGKLTTTIGSGIHRATSVIQQVDGKLVAAGYSYNVSSYDFALARYNTDGSLDTSFDGDGKLITAIGTGTDDYSYSVIQQTDGKLLVAGYSKNGSNKDFALVRYNSNGSLDTTFSGDGKLTTAIGAGDDEGHSVIQQSDGKLVVAGSSFNGTNNDFALVRYNLNGSLDTAFGSGGKRTKGIVTNSDDVSYSVIQQTDGKLVQAGYSEITANGTAEFVLIRYESGQLDTDGDGIVDWLDPDNDGDNVPNNLDAFPLDASEWVDTDLDGIGNNADTDDDNDGIADVSDNCPLSVNANQLDWDDNGIGDRCDGPVPLPDDVVGVLGKDKAGSAVAFAGDFNSDGYGDYVIGIPGFDVSTKMKDAGRAVVVSGKNGDVLASLNGTAAKDTLGTAVAGDADIDNDGFDDVVIGAPKAGSTHTGSVTILYGPDGVLRPIQVISGAVVKSAFGAAIALGDVDDDNHADILVGAPKDDDASNKLVDAGSVAVISGNDFSELKKFYGASAKANAGSSVASGDVNKDGVVDIVIGAPNDDDAVVKDSGSVKAYTLAGTSLLQKNGVKSKTGFGKSVATGDINGDGYEDILVGAPLDDDLDNALKDTGSIIVFSGNGSAELARKFGTTAKAGFGNSVAVGDVTGDGFADIIVGALKDDKPTAAKAIKDAGSVSVFSGGSYAPIGSALYGGVAKDYFGTSVSAGDINSDGKDDLVIGIPGFDAPGTKLVKDAGAVRVLSGAGL